MSASITEKRTLCMDCGADLGPWEEPEPRSLNLPDGTVVNLPYLGSVCDECSEAEDRPIM